MREVVKWPTAGLDTEFYGVDVTAESCVGRSKIDVFSVAVPSGALQPMGFNATESWVFDVGMLEIPEVRAWIEDARYRKCVHNITVDAHSLFNHGVKLRGGLNTLSMARWIYPWRVSLPRNNFDLHSLCAWRVGFGKTEDFDELLGYDDFESYEDEVEKKRCGCGELGCRKKKEPHDVKVPEMVKVTRERKVRKFLTLPEIRPGHPLFDRYRLYAAADAELALIIYQMMQIDGQEERKFPWAMM